MMIQKFKTKYFHKLTNNYQKVIVKMQYADIKRNSEMIDPNLMIDPNSEIDYRIIDCYIPAEAKIGDNGYIVIRYETVHNYDLYRSYSIYDKSNCPDLFDFDEFDTRATLLMALGLLVGYDEHDDKLKPFLDYIDEDGKYVYKKWWKLDKLYDSFRNADDELLKDSKEFNNVSCFR